MGCGGAEYKYSVPLSVYVVVFPKARIAMKVGLVIVSYRKCEFYGKGSLGFVGFQSITRLGGRPPLDIRLLGHHSSSLLGPRLAVSVIILVSDCILWLTSSMLFLSDCTSFKV